MEEIYTIYEETYDYYVDEDTTQVTTVTTETDPEITTTTHENPQTSDSFSPFGIFVSLAGLILSAGAALMLMGKLKKKNNA